MNMIRAADINKKAVSPVLIICLLLQVLDCKSSNMCAIVTPGDEKTRELADDIIELSPVLNFLSPMLAVDSLSVLAYLLC